MKLILMCLSFFHLSLAYGKQAPDYTATLFERANKLVVEAHAPQGHHFNVKAPMTLVDSSTKPLKPITADPHTIVFETSDKTPRSLKVRLYLCDDPNTFCELHEIDLLWKTTEDGKKPVSKAKPLKTSMKKEGLFFLNSPEAAFERALQEKKPLLIDFFGIWCPPCNLLNGEVFSSVEFKKSSENFVLLKMDADQETSWPLASRYAVTGYPTVIFATSSGEEIFRVVGYDSKEIFLKNMSLAYKFKEQPAVPSELLGPKTPEVKEEEKSSQQWLSEALAYEDRIQKTTHPSVLRAYKLEQAYCFWKGNEPQKAEAIYSSMEKSYPREFTFYYAHSNMHYQLKNFSKGKELAEKALKFSYGDNRLRAVHLLARNMNELQEKDEALQIIGKTLQNAKVPEDKKIRTHRYLQSLKDLENTVSKK